MILQVVKQAIANNPPGVTQDDTTLPTLPTSDNKVIREWTRIAEGGNFVLPTPLTITIPTLDADPTPQVPNHPDSWAPFNA